MPEPITTVGIGALAAYLGKDGLQKLLGPTADYLGQTLKEIAEKRVENIGKIFKNAEEKLGDRIDEPGDVPPRVLKTILDEGSYCDDLVAVEYFGGVLASSRSGQSRDDRGARIAKSVDALSVYQIRSHYLIYSTVRHLFKGTGLSLNHHDRPKMQIHFSINSYVTAMGMDQSEADQLSEIVQHVFFGLHADGLIEGMWQMGPKESLASTFPSVPDAGIICQPSALGAELFLWAFGYSNKPSDFLFSGEFKGIIEGIPSIAEGAQATKPPVPQNAP